MKPIIVRKYWKQLLSPILLCVSRKILMNGRLSGKINWTRYVYGVKSVCREDVKVKNSESAEILRKRKWRKIDSKSWITRTYVTNEPERVSVAVGFAIIKRGPLYPMPWFASGHFFFLVSVFFLFLFFIMVWKEILLWLYKIPLMLCDFI